MGQKKIRRVVLDTNIVISSLLFGGEPGKIYGLWKDKLILPLVVRIWTKWSLVRIAIS